MSKQENAGWIKPPENSELAVKTIHVNTVAFQIPHGLISYEELAKLEYPGDDVTDKEINYTISVEYPGQGPISLARGDKPVHVKEGMECHVRKSGRS